MSSFGQSVPWILSLNKEALVNQLYGIWINTILPKRALHIYTLCQEKKANFMPMAMCVMGWFLKQLLSFNNNKMSALLLQKPVLLKKKIQNYPGQVRYILITSHTENQDFYFN